MLQIVPPLWELERDHACNTYAKGRDEALQGHLHPLCQYQQRRPHRNVNRLLHSPSYLPTLYRLVRHRLQHALTLCCHPHPCPLARRLLGGPRCPALVQFLSQPFH